MRTIRLCRVSGFPASVKTQQEAATVDSGSEELEAAAMAAKPSSGEVNNNNNKIENDAGMVTPRQPLGHERRPGQQWMLASRESVLMGNQNGWRSWMQKTATRPAAGQPGGASEKTAQQDGHPPHSVLGKTSTLLCGSVVSTKTATPQKTSAASSTAAE